MKKKIFSLLIITCFIFLTGCTGNAKPSEKRSLTDEEISQANEAFAIMIETESGPEVNPISCFFTCYYTDPTEIDLEAFLRYCPVGQRLEDTDAQECSAFLAAAEFSGEAWDNKLPSQLPLPIHRKPKDAVTSLLKKYANITANDLICPETVVYLEEYDAYYTTTSDFAPGWFQCVNGEKEGNLIRLWSEPNKDGMRNELTLQIKEETYYIQSYLQVKQ